MQNVVRMIDQSKIKRNKYLQTKYFLNLRLRLFLSFSQISASCFSYKIVLMKKACIGIFVKNLLTIDFFQLPPPEVILQQHPRQQIRDALV